MKDFRVAIATCGRSRFLSHWPRRFVFNCSTRQEEIMKSIVNQYDTWLPNGFSYTFDCSTVENVTNKEKGDEENAVLPVRHPPEPSSWRNHVVRVWKMLFQVWIYFNYLTLTFIFLFELNVVFLYFY
ncbi:unnamed protein product [Cuscuta europaea]|uniref:Uncharacterized protein n=1 Tax=Cuscuta europaea TaxID=41803 RepID=A0A9P1E250_CUSEU|nr:unnamed protein product [Cuscuta europaea]